MKVRRDGRLGAGGRAADRGPRRAVGPRAGTGRGRPAATGQRGRAGLGPPVDRRGVGASGQRRAAGPQRRCCRRRRRTSCPGPPSTPCSASTGSSGCLDDPGIENINANGCDQVWVRYADGRREQVEPIAASDDELEEMLRTAAARTGIGERRFDRGSPRLSLQLPDGSRLFALMAVAARPCLSIRRHRYLRITPDDLVEMGTLDLGAAPLRAGGHAGEEVVHHLRRHRGGQDDPAARRGRRHPTHRSGWSPSRTPSSWASTASPTSTPTSWRWRPGSRTWRARAGSAWPSWSAGRCACPPTG